MLDKIMSLLDHNIDGHNTILKIRDKEYPCCSRCLGIGIAGFISFVIFGLINLLTDISFNFWLIFIGSFVLAGFMIFDWTSVAVFKIRKSNNNIRLITGALLGIGLSLYFWFLPTDWFIRLSSLLFYRGTFGMFYFIVKCSQRNINPLEEIRQNISSLSMKNIFESKIWCCPCCCPSCDPMGCMFLCLCPCCCCAICPLILKLIPTGGKRGCSGCGGLDKGCKGCG